MYFGQLLLDVFADLTQRRLISRSTGATIDRSNISSDISPSPFVISAENITLLTIELFNAIARDTASSSHQEDQTGGGGASSDLSTLIRFVQSVEKQPTEFRGVLTIDLINAYTFFCGNSNIMQDLTDGVRLLAYERANGRAYETG